MVKKGVNSRINRLDQLTGLLRSKEFWTTSELREKMNISQRTLMRDLAILQERGFPIESSRGRGGGLRLTGQSGIGEVSFTPNEITNLLLALALMEKMESPLFLQELRQIRKKVFHAFPFHRREQTHDIIKRIWVRSNASEELVSTNRGIGASLSKEILKSFFEKKLLKITYLSGKNEKTVRTIEPYYLIVIWPLWYFQAWDRKRNAIRFFRIDRILNAQALNEVFTLKRSDDFKKMAEEFFESL